MTTNQDDWFLPVDKMPPPHQQVLIELKEGPVQVCDVACYIGKTEEGDRWVLSDIRLETKQIKRWAFIYPKLPDNELKKAYLDGWNRENTEEYGVDPSLLI